MKVFGLFLTIWGGFTAALLTFFAQSGVEVAPADLMDFRVGSAALAFLAAIPATALLKRSG